MDLNFQKSAIEELTQLANSDRHSVLIEGVTGCGKSYLARLYAKLLNIKDISFVQPNVQSIREALEMSHDLTYPVVFCIENLDLGVVAASYTLLKFLEEPTSNVYIVVTCRNRFQVPDTIISRSTCVTVAIPTLQDVNDYAEIIDIAKYKSLKSLPAWKGVRALTDVDYIFRLKPEQLDYFRELKSLFNFKDTVSGLSWKLGHFPDNSETNLVFVLNYLMSTVKLIRIKRLIINCIQELSVSRMAQHIVLAKFLLDCKYGE